jgi:hypothetical protein
MCAFAGIPESAPLRSRQAARPEEFLAPAQTDQTRRTDRLVTFALRRGSFRLRGGLHFFAAISWARAVSVLTCAARPGSAAWAAACSA